MDLERDLYAVLAAYRLRNDKHVLSVRPLDRACAVKQQVDHGCFKLRAGRTGIDYLGELLPKRIALICIIGSTELCGS